MKQVNSRNRLVRPPRAILYPKTKGKEDGIEICCAGYGRNR